MLIVLRPLIKNTSPEQAIASAQPSLVRPIIGVCRGNKRVPTRGPRGTSVGQTGEGVRRGEARL